MKVAYILSSLDSQVLGEQLIKIQQGEIVPSSELAKAFREMDAIVMVMPLPQALRLLNPFWGKGLMEPALLSVDTGGRFVVPLLAGHKGIANELARKLAHGLCGTAVITTGGDTREVISFADIAKRNRLTIYNPSAIKKVSDLLLLEARVEIYTDQEILWQRQDWDKGSLSITRFQADEEAAMLKKYLQCESEGTASVFLTNRYLPPREDGTYPSHILILQPQNLFVGIGCRSKVNQEYLLQSFSDIFRRHHLASGAVAALATIPVIAEEPAVMALAKYLHVPVQTVEPVQMKNVGYLFTKAPFSQKTAESTDTISAPCAYLASEKGRLLLVRTSFPGGITFTVAQSKEPICF